MGQATRMNVDFQARILADQRASGAGVIQMNMSEKDGAEVGNAQSQLLELVAKRVKCRSRTRINECRMTLRAEKNGGNRARMAGPMEVNDSSQMHRRIECSARRRKRRARNWEEK